MNAKEEAKKKEEEERLKQQEKEAAAYSAAVDEATSGVGAENGPKVKPAGSPSTEDENVVVSGIDGPVPSGKDKIENLTGEWWKSNAVVDPGMPGKEPDEEWWKDLEGLDESMLGIERNQWSSLGSSGDNERFLSGGGVAGISEEDQAAIASADDPDTRRRVRAAYSNWCRMYNKEPDEGRFPKFKSNYLIMERMAMEQGREVTLNEFADCTPEEYRKAHQMPKGDSNAVVESESQRKVRLRKDMEEKDLRLERLRREQEEEASRSRKATERRRSVNVATQPVNDAVVDEAEAVAEVERLAMKKAEEAAQRVAANRKKNGSTIAARARARAMERKNENRRQERRLDDVGDESDKRRDSLQAQAAKRPRDMKMKRDRLESDSRPQPQRSPNMEVRWEKDRLQSERQDFRRDGGFQQGRNPIFTRDDDLRQDYPRSRKPPGPDSSQPKVKPPPSQSREPKAFPPRPSFMSPQQINNDSNPSTTSDERFLDEDSWRDPYDRRDPDRGPSRFKQNIMKLRRDMDPDFGPSFRDHPGDPRGRDPGGFMHLKSEEALIEAFEDMASFGNTDYTSPGKYGPDLRDPLRQSSYDDSYFMDLPQEEGPRYPNPEVSPPPSYSNPDPSFSNDWSDESQNMEEEDVSNVGSDWSSRSYDTPQQQQPQRDNGESPFSRRSSMMNQGSSYLDNLSKPGQQPSPPSGMNRGSSYLNELSRQPQPSSSTPPSSPPGAGMGGSEFPERIRAAYRDWCQYYDKPYNEGRLRIFAANFLAVEKYHRETGVSLILNELADMTSEEYQNRKMQ